MSFRKPERRTAARAANFLWRVRYGRSSGDRRKTERLALDLQTTLAREFGFISQGLIACFGKNSMPDYYHHARELNLLQ